MASKTAILHALGSDPAGGHALETTIARLRRGLGTAGLSIHTVRGRGYRLDAQGPSSPPHRIVALSGVSKVERSHEPELVTDKTARAPGSPNSYRLHRARMWAELGDCRRFSRSMQVVRHTGLDVTVHSSDGKRTRGHLARQGPPVLRWALFEAAKCAARHRSPDHGYYLEVRDRLGANRATLSVARKLARRCHHTLRALGDDAFAAVS